MTIRSHIRAVVSLLPIALASIASADMVSIPAPVISTSPSHVSIVSTWHFNLSATPLSSGSHAAAAGVLHAAFGPPSRPGSRPLTDALPPADDADDAPQAGPAGIVLQLGSPASPGRGPSRFVYDENPGTSSNTGTGPAIVPLPPAVFGGLVGLAALAVGRSVTRRGRSA